MILYDIVVSLYQQQLRTGNIPAPTQKKIRFAIGELKEVAHDQNPGGLKMCICAMNRCISPVLDADGTQYRFENV